MPRRTRRTGPDSATIIASLTPEQLAKLDEHALACDDDYALDLVIPCPGCKAAIAAPCAKQSIGIVCFARRLKRLMAVGRWA